jgi:hypothetical protein
VRERRPGPPPTYYLVTASSEGFAVPVWMTRSSAGELRFEERPRIDLRALRHIAELTRKELESVDRQEEVLPSDQAKETIHVDRPTPVDIDTGAAPPSTASPARGARNVRCAAGKDAAVPRATRRGSRQRQGVPR